MPNFTEMKNLLIQKMSGTTADINGAQVSIDKDPHFNDYANLGAFLSTVDCRKYINNGLEKLESEMEKNIGGTWYFYNKKKSAIQHFNDQQKAWSSKNEAPPTNQDFEKLLTKALDNFERSHGFTVPDKAPVFAGFVYGNVFKDTIKNGMHFKDIGAGEKHGEFTHRIQWYVAVHAGALVSVDKNEAGKVYKSIHRWLNKRANKDGPLLQLWNYMFDMQPSLLGNSEKLDKTDFRSPENFNLWLTGEESPNSYPLLRSFLKARRAKRDNYYMMENYLKKKLGISEGAKAFDAWQADVALKKILQQG